MGRVEFSARSLSGSVLRRQAPSFRELASLIAGLDVKTQPAETFGAEFCKPRHESQPLHDRRVMRYFRKSLKGLSFYSASYRTLSEILNSSGALSRNMSVALVGGR